MTMSQIVIRIWYGGITTTESKSLIIALIKYICANAEIPIINIKTKLKNEINSKFIFIAKIFINKFVHPVWYDAAYAEERSTMRR